MTSKNQLLNSQLRVLKKNKLKSKNSQWRICYYTILLYEFHVDKLLNFAIANLDIDFQDFYVIKKEAQPRMIELLNFNYELRITNYNFKLL